MCRRNAIGWRLRFIAYFGFSADKLRATSRQKARWTDCCNARYDLASAFWEGLLGKYSAHPRRNWFALSSLPHRGPEGVSDRIIMSPNDHDEATPLLVEQQQPSKVDVYERFSKLQKHICVAAVSTTGLLPCEYIICRPERHMLIDSYSICRWDIYTLDSRDFKGVARRSRDYQVEKTSVDI